MKKYSLMTAVAILSCGIMMTSCKDDEDEIEVVKPQQQVVLNCQRPDYLKARAKVALITPSSSTPVGNGEKTADVLRSGGVQP